MTIDEKDPQDASKWSEFQAALETTAEGCLTEFTSLDPKIAKNRLAELLQTEASQRLVCDAEMRWLAGCVECNAFADVSFLDWLEKELAPLEFLHVDFELWSPVWRGACRLDQLSFVNQAAIEDEFIEIEVHGDSFQDASAAVYRCLHRLDLILDQCNSMLLGSVSDSFNELGWEIYCLYFNVDVNGERTHQITFSDGCYPRMSFLFDDQGTVIRKRTATDLDHSRAADPFSIAVRKWHPIEKMVELQDALSKYSLIGVSPIDEQTAKLRIQQLSEYEHDYGFVYFGEKQWLASRCMSETSSQLTYAEWAKSTLIQFVFPKGVKKSKFGHHEASTQDLFFLARFDELQLKSKVVIDRVAVVWDKSVPLDFISLFHILHNLHVLIFAIESQPEFRKHFEPTDLVGFNEIRFDQDRNPIICLTNEYGGEIEYDVDIKLIGVPIKTSRNHWSI